MPRITYPNVPALPGVPSIPRRPGASVPPVIRAAIGIAQSALWVAIRKKKVWGILDSTGKWLGDVNKTTGFFGKSYDQALRYLDVGGRQSLGAIEYSKEMKTSSFPLEKGGFAAYNKVETPGLPVVPLIYSGTEAERREFLSAIDLATKSTNLYSVVTPEVTYINHSINSYRYQRSAESGLGLLVIELSLEEIRQVTGQYSQSVTATAKNAADKPAVDAGKVQPQAAQKSMLQRLADRIRGGL